MAAMAGAKTRRAARIANLRREVEAEGGPAAFARAHLGVDETYVSQILTGHRNFGDVAAENMEERCGWPPLYLDRPVDAPRLTEPVEDQPLELLPHEELAGALNMLRRYLVAAPTSARTPALKEIREYLVDGDEGHRASAVLLLLPYSSDARVAKFIKPAKSTAVVRIHDDDETPDLF